MANSGGGTILIGVADDGQSAADSAALKILQTDPAKITDKIAKYTGVQFDSFTVDLERLRTPRVRLCEALPGGCGSRVKTSASSSRRSGPCSQPILGTI
ncbi:hypothetical protein BH20VER3_BH20VER3_19370 [soil metagenome]